MGAAARHEQDVGVHCIGAVRDLEALRVPSPESREARCVVQGRRTWLEADDLTDRQTSVTADQGAARPGSDASAPSAARPEYDWLLLRAARTNSSSERLQLLTMSEQVHQELSRV